MAQTVKLQNASLESTRKDNSVTLKLILLVFLFTYIGLFFFYPLNRIYDGRGWDGVIYARIVRDFRWEKESFEENTYYLGRALPSVSGFGKQKASGRDTPPVSRERDW